MAIPVWQRASRKSKSGGLNAKGRASYNRANGGNLKAPVTTKPSKLKKGSKAANRRKSSSCKNVRYEEKTYFCQDSKRS